MEQNLADLTDEELDKFARSVRKEQNRRDDIKFPAMPAPDKEFLKRHGRIRATIEYKNNIGCSLRLARKVILAHSPPPDPGQAIRNAAEQGWREVDNE